MSSTLSCGLGQSVFAGWNGKLTISLKFAKTRNSSLQYFDGQTDAVNVVAQKKKSQRISKICKSDSYPKNPWRKVL